MDIENKVLALIEPKTKSNISSSTKDTMNLLQRQVNEHAKKTHKPGAHLYNYAEKTAYNVDNMEVLMNQEIKTTLEKKGWKSLGKTFQWDLLCEYFDGDQTQFDTENIVSVKKTLKHALQNNIDIKVKLDPITKKIIYIEQE